MKCHMSYMQAYVTQFGALVPIHVLSTCIDHKSLILALTMTLTLTASHSCNPDSYSDLNPSTQPPPGTVLLSCLGKGWGCSPVYHIQ